MRKSREVSGVLQTGAKKAPGALLASHSVQCLPQRVIARISFPPDAALSPSISLLGEGGDLL